MSEKKAVGTLFFVALLGGIGTIFNDLALQEGFSLVQVPGARFLFAFIFMFFLTFKEIKNINKEEIKAGFIIAFVYLVAFQIMMMAYKYTSVSNVAFLLTMPAILVTFLSRVFFKRKLDIYTYIAAFLMVIGTSILSLEDKFTFNVGVVLAFLSSICFAMYSILSEYYFQNKNLDVKRVTFVKYAFAAGLAVIFAYFVDRDLTQVTRKGYIDIIINGLILTGLYGVLLNLAQKYTTAVKAVLINSSQAIVAVIVGAIFLSYKITIKELIAFLFISLAIIISQTKLEFIRKRLK